MPKQFPPCICHDQVLMRAPQCTSNPALAVLFLQEKRRMNFDRRIRPSTFAAEWQEPYKTSSQLLSRHESASFSELTIHLSPRCPPFIEYKGGIVEILSATAVLVPPKKHRFEQSGGSISALAAHSSQQNSSWLLQRNPICTICSTWRVRLLQ